MSSLEKRDMIKRSLTLQSQQTRRDAAPHGMQISCWTLPEDAVDTKSFHGFGETDKVTPQMSFEG